MSGFTIHQGSALAVLRTLPAGSVDCVVTSPPYWGLRDYGVDEQIGLEASPVVYVERMVEVFREVRRVLRDDGTLWLNLGDCYAGSGRGGYPGGKSGLAGSVEGQDQTRTAKAAQASRGSPRDRLANGRGDQPAVLRKKREVSPPRVGGSQLPAGFHEEARLSGSIGRAWVPPPDGLKQKDLVGIPWRVAFALQADGWYLRSDIVWSKPNPMPESIKDRPTKAHEYIFLLAKSERYHYNGDAIREPFANGVEGATPWGANDRERNVGGRTDGRTSGTGTGWTPTTDGRNRRTVWTIPTEPFPGAHFAVMPTALVRPCVLAGCRPGGTVLDPFTGSGTVGFVALELGCEFVGIEINPEYAAMARERIGRSARAPLLPFGDPS